MAAFFAKIFLFSLINVCRNQKNVYLYRVINKQTKKTHNGKFN